MTRLLSDDATGTATAVRILREGGVVAFPTETVYGLGADATNPRGVATIFAAKARPRFNPLILHVSDRAMAERFALFPDRARPLAETFWPGPLTLVLPLAKGAGAEALSELATAGLPTVAVRIPETPVARRLIDLLGGPIVAPSANLSGRVSPTTSAHVLDELSGRIDAVIEGGPCRVGLESTILAVDPDGAMRCLRPGGLAVEEIERAMGSEVGAGGTGGPGPGARPVSAPGQLASHYAPGVRLRLDATAPAEGEGWIGFGPEPEGRGAATGAPRLTLSETGDLVEAAATLFASLREIDRLMEGSGTVAVAAVPETGIGRAINDRLRRAAAPRPAAGGGSGGIGAGSGWAPRAASGTAVV